MTIIPFHKTVSNPHDDEVWIPVGRLGERLQKAKHITTDQLQIALHEQKRSRELLGGTLVRLGFLNETKLAQALAEGAGLQWIDLKTALIDPALLLRLPKETAAKHCVLPIQMQGDTLEIAMADPYDVVAMDEVRRYFPHPTHINPRVASATAITNLLEHYSGFAASLDAILHELQSGAAHADKAWQHPVVRLVNTILYDAVKRNASDIHLEPEANFVRLRYRLDGVLQPVRSIHRAHWPELSHRLKIMGGMDIADTRNLQDGRFPMQIGGATIDFRMAVMPTAEGENIVIRVLDQRRALLPMESLGFNTPTLKQVAKILERPEGILLVTGPTGSGKTTTLYSMLNKISTQHVNIMTLEDPIEYQFGLIRQTAVQEEQGLGFAEGVRGILRQDPDIIFIGEVRDDDTAQMALRAAMTGHQVFTTLHCNDALGALPRLVDLGLHPRMMAGNISGVIAQRLVPRLCPDCKTIRAATAEESHIMRCDSAKPPFLYDSKGCDSCEQTGFKGRVAVAEILRVTPMLDELIAADAPRSALRKQAEKDGLIPMIVDGIAKVLTGDIGLSSLRRAVDMTRGMA